MKKRLSACLSLLLALCMLLSSCGGGMGAPALFTVVGDTVSGFFNTSSNLLRGNLPVVVDGELLYRPTFGTDCTTDAQAMLDRLCEKTEMEKLTVSSDPNTPKLHIDLGLKEGLTASEYYIGLSDKDLIITANNLPVLIEAIRYFERTYITGAEANAGNGFLYLPKGMAYTSPTLDVIDENGEPNYVICYPENADAADISAISVLRDAIKKKSGVALPLQSDFIAEDDVDSREILIGLTNRTESIAATADLGYDSYALIITESKIVITAKNTFMLRKGIEAFTALFVSGEDAAISYDPTYLRLPTSLQYSETCATLLFSNNYRTDYTLIYPAGMHEDAIEHIRTFQQKVMRLTGASLPAYADTERPAYTLSGGNREILIGNTNRYPATAQSSSWSITASGTDIRVQTGNDNHVRFALESLYLLLAECAKEQNAVNDKEYAPTYPLIYLDTSLHLQGSNAPDVPSFTGIVDVGEGAYMLYRDDCTAADFSAYQALLTSMGYALHTSSTAGTVRAATYYNEAEVINVTFTNTDNVLRVVVDPLEESALQPLTPVSYSSRSDIQPLFIQLGGAGSMYKKADCGMGYVVCLRDGTFLVVDGGFRNEEIAEKLWNTLDNNNQLSGKPVISCWIFTHGHMDHIGAFKTFTGEYADKVELKSVLYSFPTTEQTLLHGGSEVAREQENFRQYIGEYAGNPTVYKARTGQKLQFAGCEIEMLFTLEDYVWPKELTYFNDSSLVFGLTLSDGTTAQRLMMLGDCSVPSANILVARYGSYLQSDAVQVAHHGYDGGTAALYDAIRAAVVFWPCPLKAPNGNLRFDNPKWSKVTREMLGQDYAQVLYVAGDGDVTLKLSDIKDQTMVGIARTAESAKYPS